jgi:hypothetical protein
MADLKISALTSATTPLAGTEVLPIVQSGTTVKVAVSDLTAGRAVSATQLTLTTGNVIVANGQGIDFSATPGTGTSELLSDYEEGTWTPVVFGDVTEGTATYTQQVGNYTRIGRQVTLQYRIVLTGHTGSGNMQLKGLPFPIGVNFLSQSIAHCADLSLTAGNIPVLYNNNTGVSYLVFGQLVTGGAGTSTVPVDAAFSVRSSFTYFV